MADIKAEIQTQVQKIQDAMAKKNQDELVGFYTEDCRVLPGNAPMVEGREALTKFLGFMLQFLDKIGKVENSVVEVVPLGDMVSTVNTSVTYDKDGKEMDHGKSMTIWKKVNGNWHVHWTAWNSDKPTPAQ